MNGEDLAGWVNFSNIIIALLFIVPRGLTTMKCSHCSKKKVQNRKQTQHTVIYTTPSITISCTSISMNNSEEEVGTTK